MNKIQLVLTCEDCETVVHHTVAKEDDIEKHLEHFKNKHKKCNLKLTSYFSISTIDLLPAETRVS